MNLREIKEIFRLVEKTDFSGVEIVQGDIRIKIERGAKVAASTGLTGPLHRTTHFADSAPGEATTSGAASSSAGPAAQEPAPEEVGIFVTSPFVGTFYRSPSPDSDPYVELSSVVKKGQPLCIVEAMKLMNEIESDYDGVIAEIYVDNGRPVEYGEKLFRIVPGAR